MQLKMTWQVITNLEILSLVVAIRRDDGKKFKVCDDLQCHWHVYSFQLIRL